MMERIESGERTFTASQGNGCDLCIYSESVNSPRCFRFGGCGLSNEDDYYQITPIEEDEDLDEEFKNPDHW